SAQVPQPRPIADPASDLWGEEPDLSFEDSYEPPSFGAPSALDAPAFGGLDAPAFGGLDAPAFGGLDAPGFGGVDEPAFGAFDPAPTVTGRVSMSTSLPPVQASVPPVQAGSPPVQAGPPPVSAIPAPAELMEPERRGARHSFGSVFASDQA